VSPSRDSLSNETCRQLKAVSRTNNVSRKFDS